MSDSVYVFRDKLLAGDVKGMAAMLHEGWLRKKTLSANVSNSLIDSFYQAGMNAGAWGGKILGAGGGGCLLLLAAPETHAKIRASMKEVAAQNSLHDFQELPVRFTQSGTDILFNAMKG